MGTRCLTHFVQNHKIICTLYRQFDGYPDGHGKELAEFLADFKIVNGIRSSDQQKYLKLANGMGCLAAQVIAAFKTGVGQFYMTDDVGQEEYTYTVYVNELPNSEFELRLKCETDTVNGSVVMFDGKPKDFDAKKAYETYEKLTNSEDE